MLKDYLVLGIIFLLVDICLRPISLVDKIFMKAGFTTIIQ